MLESTVKMGVMNCQGDSTSYCKLQGVNEWPTLRIYPAKVSPNSKPLYIPYQGYRRQSSRLVSWIIESVDLFYNKLMYILLLNKLSIVLITD